MDTKIKVLNTTERDDQGSKVSDFFERTEDMFNEMKWQKKLRGIHWIYDYESYYQLKIHYFRSTHVVLDEQLHVIVE